MPERFVLWARMRRFPLVASQSLLTGLALGVMVQAPVVLALDMFPHHRALVCTDGYGRSEHAAFCTRDRVALCACPVRFQCGVIRGERPLPGGHPEHLQDVSAIAVTAHARPEDRDAAPASGFNGYGAKPLDREMLLSRVAALLARRSSPKRRRRTFRGSLGTAGRSA